MYITLAFKINVENQVKTVQLLLILTFTPIVPYSSTRYIESFINFKVSINIDTNIEENTYLHLLRQQGYQGLQLSKQTLKVKSLSLHRSRIRK